MNAQDLITLLQPHFPSGKIEAANQGNKFDVRVVDDALRVNVLSRVNKPYWGWCLINLRQVKSMH